MDRTEEDMKNIGFFGIFNQSFKSIFSSPKIFTKITLAFIIPLEIIFIIQLQLTQHVFFKIENNRLTYDTNDTPKATALLWLYYALYTIAYYIFLTVFSVFAISSVTFTVASVYTNRDVIFRHVIKVIPKVWKRLCITFVYIYLTQFIYDVIVGVVTAIFRAIFGNTIAGFVSMIILFIIFGLLFLYLTVVCQLASVVTVLENIYGSKALKKGKQLTNGKKKVGMGIAFVLYLLLIVLLVVYLLFVEYGDQAFDLALIWRVMIGIVCGLVFLVWLLVFIVTQTVLYLVCKSYHREAIDKLGLSTFLSAYVGETVVYPRSGDEIQLGRTQNPVEQV